MARMSTGWRRSATSSTANSLCALGGDEEGGDWPSVGANRPRRSEMRTRKLGNKDLTVSMTRLYEPKHLEVARVNPKQQVPVLVDGDLEIFDSTQIFEYLEDLAPTPPLWPPGPAARARARLVELKSDEVYFPHIIRLMGLQE